jgi:superfamily II DNA or RNA helicase
MVPDGPGGWSPDPWVRAMEAGYDDGLKGRPLANVAATSRGNSYRRGYREGLREALRRGPRWPYFDQVVAQEATLAAEASANGNDRRAAPLPTTSAGEIGAPRSARRSPEAAHSRARPETFRCVQCREVLPVSDRSEAFRTSCKACLRNRDEPRHDTAEQLIQQLTSLVQQHPGLTTGELVALLPDSGATKGEINVLLHGSTERFISIHQPPDRVRWYPRALHDRRGQFTSRGGATSERDGSGLDLYPWQREALATWRQHDRRGLIEAVTGTGKTHLGLEAAREELLQNGRVLVLVPTRELQDQWYEQLTTTIRGYHIGRLGGGHKSSLSKDDVLVATVQSASRQSLLLPRDRHGLLVADECHRYGAETFRRALDWHFAHRLGLSATPERSDDAHLEYLEPYFGGPPIFRLGYRRAIAEGVVARFKLALVGVRFAESEQQAYDELTDILQEARQELLKAGVPQEPFGAFMKAVGDLADDWSDPARWAAKRYLQAFSRRRQVLASARRKTTVVGELAQAVKRARGSLLFTMTTDHADHLARVMASKGIEAAALHSELSMRHRRTLLERFGRRQLQALAAPMVLDEGVDVPEADLAIIVAASKSERQMIQRMGRVLRKKVDGRLARIAIVYVAQTMEDPARGAHEVFLDTVRSVAHTCRNFPPGSSIMPVVTFLNDFGATPR